MVASTLVVAVLGPATALLLPATPAGAAVPLTASRQYLGTFDYTGTGATLRTQPNGVDSCAVTTDPTSATLSGIPAGATVEQALLYWGGSYNSSASGPGSTPDGQVTFQGSSVSGTPMTDTYSSYEFFGVVADVTSLVSGNGTYTLDDLDIWNGAPHCGVSGVFGGWNLLVVYEQPGLEVKKILVYEGLEHTRNSSNTYPITGFVVPSAGTIEASVAVMAWEGDDTLQGGGEGLTFAGAAVSDPPANPVSNVFNGTNTFTGSGSTYGNDFDVYDVSSLLSPGQTSADLVVTSGDDLVLMEAVVLEVPTEFLNLSIAKSSSSSSATVGDTVTFSVAITNEGPDVADNVVVADSLPAGLAYQSSTATVGAYDPVTGNWAISSLPIGTATLDIVTVVTSTGVITNTASVTQVDQEQLQVLDDSDSATVTVGELAIVKTANTAGPVTAGDEIEYQVSVTNGSSGPHSGIVVSDTLPAGATYVAGSTVVTGGSAGVQAMDGFESGGFSGGTGWASPWAEINESSGGAGPSGGNITVVNGYLEIDRAASWFSGAPSVERSVDLSAASTASLSFDISTGGANEGSDSVRVEFAANGADFTSLGTFSNDPNQSVSYELSGPFSADATVRFVIANRTFGSDDNFRFDNVTIDASSDAPDRDNAPGGSNPDLFDGTPPNLVTVADGYSLAAGQTMTVTFRATVDPLDGSFTELLNVASVQSDAQPTLSTTNLLDVGFAPLLMVAKEADVATASPGDSVGYTVTVTHATGSDGSPVDLVVDDPLVSLTLTSGDADSDGRLDGVETWTYTGSYVVQPGDPDPLLNTVTVDGTDLDGDPIAAVTGEASVDLLGPPTAIDDLASTVEDAPVTVDVLGNDSDPEGDALTVVSVSDPGNGSAVVNADGTVTYTPYADFSGADSFTYTISDGNGGTDTATVTITVSPVNDAPEAVDDAGSTVEDTPVVVEVLENDSDPEGDALTVVSVSDPGNGSAVVNADGTVTYIPDADFSGADSFTYTISDGNGGTDSATVTVTVDPVNDDPTAVDDSYSTDEDTPLSVTAPGVLDNDLDIDGDTLVVSLPVIVDVGNGSLTVNSDGSFTYTPAPGFNGADSFAYAVSDGNGGTDTATVTITVDPVNDDPTAVDDSATTVEDTPVAITVLANDFDVDGDTITMVSVSDPQDGSATVNADGTVTYSPDADFNGTDSFTYTISDGNGGTDTATVTITVDPVNDDPTAVDDVYTTDEETTLSITAPGILDNDEDADGDGLSVAGVNTSALDGVLTWSTDGSFEFTPDADFWGDTSFDYTVSDPSGSTSAATVTISVTALPDPPVAADDITETDEDTAVIVDVLANDTDPEGDLVPATVTVVGVPSSGTAESNVDGTITYVPSENSVAADSFEYQVCDTTSLCDSATVTVTVVAQPDAPTANDDANTTDEDTTILTDVLLNDADPDGDLDPSTLSVVAQPSFGAATVVGGQIEYAPDGTSAGSAIVTYQVCDLTGLCDTAELTVLVNPLNDPPTAEDDWTSTDEDQPVTIDPRTNDSDVDGDNLAVVGVTQPSAETGSASFTSESVSFTPADDFFGLATFTYTVCDPSDECDTASISVDVGAVDDPPVAQDDVAATDEEVPVRVQVLTNDYDVDGDDLSVVSATDGVSGTVEVNPDGTVTYTPVADFAGTDEFTYEITDGTTLAQAVVSVNVNEVNDQPTAVDDSASTDEDTPVVIDVTANDSDPDGDALSLEEVTDGANGFVAVNPDGTVTYTPSSDFNGSDSFSYTVTDGRGGYDAANVSITIAAVDDPPVAGDDVAATVEAIPVAISVLDNDSDAEGDPITVVVVSDPAQGSAEINPDGTITYTPAALFVGTDSFTYDIEAAGLTDSATVEVTVAAGTPPLAGDDSATVDEDGRVDIDVLSNDSDPDGGDLTVTAVSEPTNGSAIVNPDQSVAYVPDANYSGDDSFTYSVCDPSGDCTTAQVTVAVLPLNDDPLALDDAYTTDEDTSLTIGAPGVLSNDSDPDGDPVSVDAGGASVTVEGGTVEVLADGSLLYAPAADFTGTDSFDYLISDGNGGTATASVFIEVSAINDPPVATDDAASVDEDDSVTIDVLANDDDPDGDPIVVESVASPANGTVSVETDGTLTYAPVADYFGTDTFTYRVCDNATPAECDTADVVVTVNAVNDDPVAGDDAASTEEGSAVEIEVLANDSDPDGDPLTVTSAADGSSGVVSVDTARGTVTYTPAEGFTGTDSFGYSVEDGKGGAATATVTVTVNSTNQPPVATDDTATTGESTPVVVSVLDNDRDPDGDQLVVGSVTQPSAGEVGFTDDAVTFTPAVGQTGDVSFTYTACDPEGACASASVVVTVSDVNVAPTVGDESVTTSRDTAIEIDVLANDFDPDGDSISVRSVTQPTNGSASVNPDETITYTPDSGYVGSDEFTYEVCDPSGACAIGSVSVDVMAANLPPEAVDDVASTGLGIPVVIDVLDNDADPNGDALSIGSVGVASNGSTDVNPDGTITYTPSGGFTGVDSFTYTVTDDQGGVSDPATVTVTVGDAGGGPTAEDDFATTSENASVDIPVLANDSDPDGDGLTVVSVSDPADGSVTINIDGTVTYSPDANSTGTDTFTYVISDGNGGTDTATVTVTVNPVNDPPVARDDSFTVEEDTPTTLAVLANDQDAANGPPLDASSVMLESLPVHGLVAVNGDGSVEYYPALDYVGPDSFTYRVCDTGTPLPALCDVATVRINVVDVNDAPVARPNTYFINQGTIAAGNVVADDTGASVDYDVDGDLTPDAVVETLPAAGTLALAADGSFIYTPGPGFSGEVTFTYTVVDDDGAVSLPAIVVINVVPVEGSGGNRPPEAEVDVAATTAGVPVAIAVLDNDSDPDDDPLTVDSAGDPANGGVSVNPDGTVVYTPGVGFTGVDTFIYTVCDDQGACDSAVVSVLVGLDGFGRVTGRVWLDADQDGTIGDGELDIPGVRIVLSAAGPDQRFGTDDDIAYPAAYTASPYLFDPVLVGPVRVTVDLASLSPRLAATFDEDGGRDGQAIVVVPAGGTAIADFGFVLGNGAPDLVPGFNTTLEAQLGSVPASLLIVDPDGDATSVTLDSGALPAGLTLGMDGIFGGAATETGTFPGVVEICDDFTPQACTLRSLSIVITTAAGTDPVPGLLPLPDGVPDTLPLPENPADAQSGSAPVAPGTLPLTGGFLIQLLLAGLSLVVVGVGAIRATGKD